ncbi:MAG: hypothetical protein WBP59_17765 [Ilumatobacteraceae bacterium]
MTTSAVTVRPLHRPPLGVRLVFGFLGLAVVLFNVALMLSDQAPGFLRRIFGDALDRLSDRIDAGARIPAEQLPASDTVVHVLVWGAATLLIGLTVWTWRGLALAALGLLAVSACVEIAQGAYSSSRSVEASDAVANALGVGVGVALAAVCYLAWSAGAAIFGRTSS